MQFILMSVAARVPVPKVFVNCFLHVLTTHPALRKGYFLPAEVIKSKSYKMLIGCCVPTSTQGVQQGLDLPPRISAIRCVPLHKRCGHVINHTRTERREGDLCVRQESRGLCTFREPICTQCCRGVWPHHILTSVVTARTETSAAHGFTRRCLPTLTQIRGILL